MHDTDPTVMGQAKPRAMLVVQQGTQAGMSFPISGSHATIGREETADIILQDPEVSRRHTRISWQGGQFIIEDLGSTNGTFVNGVQITSPRVLSMGDSVGMGQTALVFQMSGPPTTYPATTPAYSEGYQTDSSEQLLKYSLYGCSCLFLLCICLIIMIIGLVLADPQLFEEITGIGIAAMQLLPLIF